MMAPQKPSLVLVAGPYRSGTNDDPALIQKNILAMNQMALAIYEKGHLPIIAEWLSLPLLKTAGSTQIGDEKWNELFHPVAIRLIAQCDMIFRMDGESVGADEIVRIGKEKGKLVIFNLSQLRA